jgi:hypothetical protein
MSELTFDGLVERFAAEVSSRQLHLAETFPDIASGGWDVDLVNARLRFRQSGRTCPIEVVGSEAGGTWMWGWHNRSFAPRIVDRVSKVRDWGEQRGVEELFAPGLQLDPPEPGALLTSMACAAVVAGLTDAPGIFVCHDRARDARLYVLLLDEALREPPPPDPLARIVTRYPLLLAMAARTSHEGGVPIADWLGGLDGYCRSLGVEGRMEGDDVVLTWNGREATARMGERGLELAYTA